MWKSARSFNLPFFLCTALPMLHSSNYYTAKTKISNNSKCQRSMCVFFVISLILNCMTIWWNMYASGISNLMTKAGPGITATIALIPLYTHKGGWHWKADALLTGGGLDGGSGSAGWREGVGFQLEVRPKTDLLLRLLRCFQLTDEIALHFDLLQNLLTRITHIPCSMAKNEKRQTVDSPLQKAGARRFNRLESTRRFMLSFPAFSCFFCAAGQKNSHAVVNVTVRRVVGKRALVRTQTVVDNWAGGHVKCIIYNLLTTINTRMLATVSNINCTTIY